MMNADRNYEVARQACKNNHWHFNEDEDRHVLKMGFNVKTKFGHIDVIIHAKEQGTITYGILPIRGDKETEANLIKYIAMANYGLVDGCFEYDVSDGEIRYKSFVPGYAELTEDAVERSVGVTVKMVDRYGNGLGKLAWGMSDPDTEIKEAEGSRQSMLADLARLLKGDDDEDSETDEDHEVSEDEVLAGLDGLLEHLKAVAREHGIDVDDDGELEGAPIEAEGCISA